MKQYFLTKGSGQSQLNSVKNHTTSFDDALVNAGIGNINIVTVSSMIPPNVSEVNYQPQKWGDIVFCIMARKDGTRGKNISCALLINEIFYGNELLGSIVLEYSGNGSEKVAQEKLLSQLGEMIQRRKYGNASLKLYVGSTTTHGYTIVPKRFIYEHVKVKKRYGTVMCSLCFI
jgi:arginine decarboxylase